MHLLIQGPSVKTPAWAQGGSCREGGVSRYLAFHLGAIVGVRLRGHHEAVSVDPQITGVEGKAHLGWREGSLTLCGTSERSRFLSCRLLGSGAPSPATCSKLVNM